MRGFRGSRAAQNKMSARFGRPSRYQSDISGGGEFESDRQNKLKNLPDWLKTPETRAKELQEAQSVLSKPPVAEARSGTPAAPQSRNDTRSVPPVVRRQLEIVHSSEGPAVAKKTVGARAQAPGKGAAVSSGDKAKAKRSVKPVKTSAPARKSKVAKKTVAKKKPSSKRKAA